MGITDDDLMRYIPLFGLTMERIALTSETKPKNRNTPEITLFRAESTASVTSGLNRLAPRILSRSTEKKVRKTIPKKR